MDLTVCFMCGGLFFFHLQSIDSVWRAANPHVTSLTPAPPLAVTCAAQTRGVFSAECNDLMRGEMFEELVPERSRMTPSRITLFDLRSQSVQTPVGSNSRMFRCL